MEAKYSIVNPDEVVMSLEIKMTLGDWKKINKQLPNDYPSWKLSAIINTVIERGNRVFTHQEDISN